MLGVVACLLHDRGRGWGVGCYCLMYTDVERCCLFGETVNGVGNENLLFFSWIHDTFEEGRGIVECVTFYVERCVALK